MSKKIVVTGSTGFVGSNLVEFLLKKNFEIYLIVRENSSLKNLEHIKEKVNFFRYDGNLDNLITFFEKEKPEGVFHLASNFIAEHNYTQTNSLIESNIKFGTHILEAMKETGVRKLINTGTSWQHYNNDEYNPVCLYAATKQAFESIIDYYVEAEGFNVVTLKLYDTYGENDKRPKLINILNNLADEKTELNMSEGDQPLNLVHISDVCSAFFRAFNLLNESDTNTHKKYAVKHKDSFTLKEVINLFEKTTKKKLIVNWGGRPYRKREVMKLWDKGDTIPQWSPKVSLEEGFQKYS